MPSVSVSLTSSLVAGFASSRALPEAAPVSLRPPPDGNVRPGSDEPSGSAGAEVGHRREQRARDEDRRDQPGRYGAREAQVARMRTFLYGPGAAGAVAVGHQLIPYPASPSTSSRLGLRAVERIWTIVRCRWTTIAASVADTKAADQSERDKTGFRSHDIPRPCMRSCSS